MCGIAGIIAPHNSLVQQHRLKAMAETLQHRGPDGEGFWINEKGTVGFAHNRLAVIDLSPEAGQPLHYLHYTIIFNGEIYNYRELKSELRQNGYSFLTSSDTEIIPAAYDHWGIECLNHFDGMFAIAMQNNITGEVIIARDRFGEKPIYYTARYHQRRRFEELCFASEIKALWPAGVPKNINGTMLLNYLSAGYVQNPIKKNQTFFNDILSLPPGHYLTITPELGKVTMQKWYTLKSTATPSFQQSSYTEVFRDLFFTSVKRRLNSDVPVATSLSGGVDSSCIVAAIDQLKKINAVTPNLKNECFTASFPGFEKDELAESNRVANYFKIRQHVLTPTANDCIQYFDAFMFHQDEPVQSSSAFTQFLLYQLAKEKKITVLLDGQGADEILGGYTRYTQWHLQYLLRTDFKNFQKEKRQLKQNNFLEAWSLKNYTAAYFPKKTASLLQEKAFRHVTHQPHIQKDFQIQFSNRDSFLKPEINNTNDILYYNSFTHGLEELLRYADRNSMAHSREIRLPFLNHDLVEFIFSLPPEYKIRNGFTKWVLRESMRDFLPAATIWRKGKIGYEPPQKLWMKQKPMQEMIMESRKVLVKEGVLKSSVLQFPVVPKAAHDDNNFDWRYLSAARLFK